jgi:NodT family efflux transporter outer membrane factor (OMF) lipoprotein
MKVLGWAVLVGMLLGGCVSPVRRQAVNTPDLPPTWRAQWETPADVPHAPAPPELVAHSSEPSRQPWWRTFDDARLDSLIEAALANNPDLAMAALTVHRALLEADRVGAETGPQAALAASVEATRAFDENRVRALAGVNGTVSYELDLWGKIAARRDEASWRAQASEADRQAAALALVGATAKLYWRIGYLNETIALAQADILDAQRTLALAQARLAAGAASPIDVARAQQQLAEAQADLTHWRQQRESQRNALALLIGELPERRAAEPSDLDAAIVPRVAARLPAQVLASRPDLQAAEWRVRALAAHVDFARASLYPSFTLTGELGTSSDMLVRVMQNPVASIGAALALPFVQWNTVRLNAALAETELEYETLKFRQTLYRALGDVEDALSAKAQLTEKSAHLAHSLSAATNAAALARRRYESGATDIAPLLDAQRTERAAAKARTENRLALLENRMDLFLALGGA